jgi:DNA-binding transcriptional LysR family regulator
MVNSVMINPQFLRTFSVLAESKSFIATAKKLRMTQPGVSQHLKYLEEAYGVVLINRRGKHFQLTEAGHKLKKFADEIQVEFEQFKQSIGSDDPHSGIISLACPGSFGLMLYTFLIDLNLQYRDLRIQFLAAPNTDVIAGVQSERFKIGFISHKLDDPGFSVQKLSEEEVMLIAPKRARIRTFEQIKELGFIAHPDGYRYAERLLSENFPREFKSMEDIPLKGFINQVNRILDPVAAGLGFSVLPEHAVEAFPRLNQVQIVKLPKRLIDPICLVTKKGADLPRRYGFVLERLRDHLHRTSH